MFNLPEDERREYKSCDNGIGLNSLLKDSRFVEIVIVCFN